MVSRAFAQTESVINDLYNDNASGRGVLPIISAGFQSVISVRIVVRPAIFGSGVIVALILWRISFTAL